MLSRLLLASLIAATPFSALAQSKGSPSFGTVTASQFVGPLSGNATSATTAQSATTANTATSATMAQSATTATTATSATTAGTAGTAGSLATPRTITVSGDAGCSFAFDGSANTGCSLSLAASGVTAGTFGSGSAVPSVTVDAKGRVTGITTAAISFPVTTVAGRAGAVTLAVGDVSGAAPVASPAFTGTPAAPTAAANTNTTQLATTAFVSQAVAAVSGGGTPTTRQILTSGLATGGGDLTADRTITVPKAAQADVATGTDDAKALTSLSIASALGAKAPLASPAFTGTPTVPTAAANTNTTQAASTAFVTGALGSYLTTSSASTTYAPLASPTFTGTPAAPTPAANDNTTKLATTAYADRAASNAAAGVTYTPPSGSIVNSARAQTALVSTTTVQTPISDTAPTTSNTSAVSGLSVSITPRAAANKLRVRAVVQGSLSTVGAFVASVFQGGANAVATNFMTVAGNGYSTEVVVTYEVVAGGTSAITFSVGVGSNNSGTLTINGIGGGRNFGGTTFSSIEVTEALP